MFVEARMLLQAVVRDPVCSWRFKQGCLQWAAHYDHPWYREHVVVGCEALGSALTFSTALMRRFLM
jgi:hypothetical protein